MKSGLVLKRHEFLINENIIEIWNDGKFIGQVTGLDGRGIRVVSKYPITAEKDPNVVGGNITVLEVKIGEL